MGNLKNMPESASSKQRHEINNIAAILLGNSELGLLPSADAEYHFKEIKKATERLLKLVEDA